MQDNRTAIKSFCLRDRGRLGNEGQPISPKIFTQSCYVEFPLASGCYVNLDLFEAYGKLPKMACFSDLIFFMPIFYIGKS